MTFFWNIKLNTLVNNSTPDLLELLAEHEV